MKDKQFLKNIAVLLVTAAVCVTSGSMFLDQQKPDVLNLDNPNLTGVVKLSDYNENLKGTVNDVDIYVFDSGVPGGKALIYGGTHTNKISLFFGFFKYCLVCLHNRSP